MTNRERFHLTLNFEKPDRLPMIEWATWWDKTVHNWKAQGVPSELENIGLFHYWGLDDHRQFWISNMADDFNYNNSHENGYIKNEEDYEAILPKLYPSNTIDKLRDELLRIKPLHDRGEIIVWITLEGFFWWPRVLWGIENHFYSFYDSPELYKRICRDAAEYYLSVLEEFCNIITPDFMTFAEDMSYNHGPMLSESTFDEFVKPYYQMLVPVLKKHGIRVFIDTDGNVMPMVPWLLGSGIEGILPLERQSHVDVALLREKYPQLLMIGAFDKLVMKNGENAIRTEFERLWPVMKSGGFIASVDHQTPPDVSVDNYRAYLRVYNEFCSRI